MQEHLSPVGATGAADAQVMTHGGECVLSPPPPPTATFLATTEWLASGEPLVSVTGELDLTTASILEESLLTLTHKAKGAVIVDLARCDFIDFHGLRVLLDACERLQRSNHPLVLVCGNPNLLRVFNITRVAELFTIYPSLTAVTERHNDG